MDQNQRQSPPAGLRIGSGSGATTGPDWKIGHEHEERCPSRNGEVRKLGPSRPRRQPSLASSVVLGVVRVRQRNLWQTGLILGSQLSKLASAGFDELVRQRVHLHQLRS